MQPSADPNKTHSAEQPVAFTSLRDCEAWLATLPAQEKTRQQPLQRLSHAIKCLQAQPSRQKKQDIRHIAKYWGVLLKTKGKNYTANELVEELEKKVIREATRLQQLQMLASSEVALPSWSAVLRAFKHRK